MAISSSTGDDADDSIQHAAQFRAGVKPGDVLPVGLGVGAAWYREDISNFDQRIDDFHVRGDVTLPVSQTVALVGGVGYERVKSSQRDVVRDGAGRPVIDDVGHYRLDKDAPRQIAYDVDGLIWDVGLLWRPSPRTSLEAHMGRRYGSATYYGSFSWQASRRSSVNVSVYDSMSGFGGQLNRSLVSLPTDFEAIRDPVSGELNGCVGSLKKAAALPVRWVGCVPRYSVRAGFPRATRWTWGGSAPEWGLAMNGANTWRRAEAFWALSMA